MCCLNNLNSNYLNSCLNCIRIGSHDMRVCDCIVVVLDFDSFLSFSGTNDLRLITDVIFGYDIDYKARRLRVKCELLK